MLAVYSLSLVDQSPTTLSPVWKGPDTHGNSDEQHTNPTKALEITRWHGSGGDSNLFLIHYEDVGESDIFQAKGLGAVCMKGWLSIQRCNTVLVGSRQRVKTSCKIEAGTTYNSFSGCRWFSSSIVCFSYYTSSCPSSSSFSCSFAILKLLLHIFILFPLSIPFITLIFAYFSSSCTCSWFSGSHCSDHLPIYKPLLLTFSSSSSSPSSSFIFFFFSF